MLARAVVVFRCVNQESDIAAVVGVDTKPAELSRCCGVDHNVHNIQRMERQRREQDTGAEPLDVPHHIGQWITEMSTGIKQELWQQIIYLSYISLLVALLILLSIIRLLA